MRVLVCGSRHLYAYKSVLRELSRFAGLDEQHVLIHGAQRGVDSAADAVGKRMGWRVEPFPAEWKKYGNAAGPIRNQRMLDEGKPDLVLAFHTSPGLGRGTADMVRRARAAGIPVEVFIL